MSAACCVALALGEAIWEPAGPVGMTEITSPRGVPPQPTVVNPNLEPPPGAGPGHADAAEIIPREPAQPSFGGSGLVRPRIPLAVRGGQVAEHRAAKRGQRVAHRTALASGLDQGRVAQHLRVLGG
jgi:hypothetical protein